MDEPDITPEAWIVDPDDPLRVIDVQDVTIARTYMGHGDPPNWAENNALLIAAAPMLYRALREMMYHFETDATDTLSPGAADALEISRAAITLASGS